MRQIYKLSEKVAEFGEDQQRIISETLLPAVTGRIKWQDVISTKITKNKAQ